MIPGIKVDTGAKDFANHQGLKSPRIPPLFVVPLVQKYC